MRNPGQAGSGGFWDDGTGGRIPAAGGGSGGRGSTWNRVGFSTAGPEKKRTPGPDFPAGDGVFHADSDFFRVPGRSPAGGPRHGFCRDGAVEKNSRQTAASRFSEVLGTSAPFLSVFA